MTELDLTRPIGRPSDQQRLVGGILAGTLGVAETTWLEWKSKVDWTSPVDVAVKVARHVLGFANRDPVEAQAFVGGEAYLIFLADPTNPSMTRIDPADIENKLAPYLGTDGPSWSVSHVALNGSVSLLLTVAPPRAGDHIHALRKQAEKYPNGTVFVRRPGKTEQADYVDIRRLELRAQAATSQIGVEVSARPTTIQRLSIENDIDPFIEAERNRLLAPLVAQEYQVGGGQQAVLESLMGVGILKAIADRRKPSEFRAECAKYLQDVAAVYAESGHHMAALKGLGEVELRVTNPSARNLLGVEVELLLPAEVVASRGEWDEPSHLPKAPIAWGSDSVMGSIAHPSRMRLSSALLLGRPASRPSVWHLGAGDGLVFEAFDLRPYKHHVLPPVHLFCAGSPTGVTLELRWRATAQNADSRVEGTLSFQLVSPEFTLMDLLGAARDE